MSDYCKEKVLRVPLDKYGLTRNYFDENFSCDPLLDYAEEGKFQLSPTETDFLDFVLEYSYGWECGEYGKSRALNTTEKEKYKTSFEHFIPNINMDDVRLVEFCWYNCSEAPNYYDEQNDEFYKEV